MEMNQFLPQGNPKKTLRMVLMVSMVMLALWLLMVQRIDSGNQPEVSDPETSERLESVRSLRGVSDDQPAEVTERGNTMMPGAMSTFLVLSGILLLVWFWVRSKPGDHTPQEQFHQIASHVLGTGGQHLSVLEINGEMWVLGVTSASVTLLHRYPKDAWITPPSSPLPPPSSSFKDLLKAKL
jgi:flagellar biogenesis protein FliO